MAMTPLQISAYMTNYEACVQDKLFYIALIRFYLKFKIWFCTGKPYNTVAPCSKESTVRHGFSFEDMLGGNNM